MKTTAECFYSAEKKKTIIFDLSFFKKNRASAEWFYKNYILLSRIDDRPRRYSGDGGEGMGFFQSVIIIIYRVILKDIFKIFIQTRQLILLRFCTARYSTRQSFFNRSDCVTTDVVKSPDECISWAPAYSEIRNDRPWFTKITKTICPRSPWLGAEWLSEKKKYIYIYKISIVTEVYFLAVTTKKKKMSK